MSVCVWRQSCAGQVVDFLSIWEMNNAIGGKQYPNLNLSSCNSDTSDYQSKVIQGPVHSTPRESEQSLLSYRSPKPRNDVEVYLQAALSQRDKELSTVLKAYESVLVAWERDRRSQAGTTLADKNGRRRIMGDSVLKRCSSIASESSHDSGHQTDSTAQTGCSSLPAELYPVIDLVKAFAQHLCFTQHELDSTKDENSKLKKQVEELQKKVYEDTRQSVQNNLDAIKDEQINILANQAAALVMELSKANEELHNCHKSQKLTTKELESSREQYHNVMEEIKFVKMKNEELNEELKLKNLSRKENDTFRSQLTITAQDEHQKNVPALNDASHERLHMELNTLKMLTDRQQEVIQVLQKCLCQLDNKPTRDSDVQQPLNIEPHSYLSAQHCLSQLSVECGPLTDDSNFGSSASTLTNISELSCLTWTSRSSSASTADGDRSESSQRSSVHSRLKRSMPLKLNGVLQSTENDKSLLKLNKLLMDSRDMLCSINRSSHN